MANNLHRFPGWRIESSATGALKDCSLIIATYQRPKEISLLVQKLIDLPDTPAEVIIVDGSPGKDTEVELLEVTKSHSLPFDLIYVRSPAGLTRQRNVGIDISSKQYVYFLDDDCLPQLGYFKEIRRVFIEDETGKVGAICGLVINEINRPTTLRWRIRFALRLVPRLRPGSYYPSGTCTPKGPVIPFSGVRPVDDLHGCSMAFRRAVLDRHRFSEFFHGYAQGEDLEMSLRIRREWQILWCGDAHVAHYHAPSGRPTSFPKGVMEVRNRYFIWKRYSADAKFIDKLRFWLDMGFLMVMDMAWFALHPSHFYSVSHALGVAWGVIGCIISPPRYKEPTARKQYDLYLGALSGE